MFTQTALSRAPPRPCEYSGAHDTLLRTHAAAGYSMLKALSSLNGGWAYCQEWTKPASMNNLGIHTYLASFDALFRSIEMPYWFRSRHDQGNAANYTETQPRRYAKTIQLPVLIRRPVTMGLSCNSTLISHKRSRCMIGLISCKHPDQFEAIR